MEIYQEVGYDLLNPAARSNSLVMTFPKVRLTVASLYFICDILPRHIKVMYKYFAKYLFARFFLKTISQNVFILQQDDNLLLGVNYPLYRKLSWQVVVNYLLVKIF